MNQNSLKDRTKINKEMQRAIDGVSEAYKKQGRKLE